MRRMVGWAGLLACAALVAATYAEAASKKRERAKEQHAPAQPPDKRDTVVNAPGTPFHGRAYWQALSQCGGVYFRLGTLYEEAAIQAQMRTGKIDPKAGGDLLTRASMARRKATQFYVGSENFLMADRGMNKDQAILTYDPRAAEAGDRLKSVDAALQAARPCSALYQSCQAAAAKMCRDALVSDAGSRAIHAEPGLGGGNTSHSSMR